MDQTEPEKLDVALHAAIAAHRTALRRESEQQSRRFEQGFLLARLGLAPDELAAAAAAASACALPPDLISRIEGQLVAESDRLARLARCSSARYDLNRHIALHRALTWIRSKPADRAEPKDEDRPSGRALNNRFRPARRRSVQKAAIHMRPCKPSIPPQS